VYLITISNWPCRQLIGACLKSQTKSEEAESRGRCSGTGPPSYQLNRNHGLISCMFFTKISDSLASHVKESFFFFLEAPVLAFSSCLMNSFGMVEYYYYWKMMVLFRAIDLFLKIINLVLILFFLKKMKYVGKKKRIQSPKREWFE